jgi:hypothetical protein
LTNQRMSYMIKGQIVTPINPFLWHWSTQNKYSSYKIWMEQWYRMPKRWRLWHTQILHQLEQLLTRLYLPPGRTLDYQNHNYKFKNETFNASIGNCQCKTDGMRLKTDWII